MAYTKIHAIKATVDKAMITSAIPTKQMSKSMFHLMRVCRKQQRLTLSTPLTIAGRTVLTKPII